ncbi:MAG TPA: DNA-3-methyladenine glycosylase I [Vicinamibacterales bacterium]|nr:DNA-3-methyladenine glycosylase I [Vicinamibacterales bacterium]
MPSAVSVNHPKNANTADQRTRCGWARTPLGIAYHDLEWGVPVHEDRVLFEFLTLEGAQAGLSWETILRKRDAYRAAFAGFDPGRVARFTAAQIARLLANPGIVRNRLKIASTVGNARAFRDVQREFGSFDAYVWRFVDGVPRVNRWRRHGQVPARTPQSDALSRDLSIRGFKFTGSTICYAFMQAVGMVNDHTIDCFRYERVGGPEQSTFSAPDISRMGYNPANFAFRIGTGPWSRGYAVSYAVSFYDDRTRSESPRSTWWGPKTDPKKLYGGFGLIRIPVDPTGRATARRIWRSFAGQSERMIHEIPDNTTTRFQDDVL